jgi:hypothetical protein
LVFAVGQNEKVCNVCPFCPKKSALFPLSPPGKGANKDLFWPGTQNLTEKGFCRFTLEAPFSLGRSIGDDSLYQIINRSPVGKWTLQLRILGGSGSALPEDCLFKKYIPFIPFIVYHLYYLSNYTLYSQY